MSSMDQERTETKDRSNQVVCAYQEVVTDWYSLPVDERSVAMHEVEWRHEVYRAERLLRPLEDSYSLV